MGGSSGQVTGYRYFANFLLFIGNPIENLLAINFDKRGWMTGRRGEIGYSGELIHIEAQDIYGENEGGVYGVVNLHKGTDLQLPDEKYSQYMQSIGLKPSAYPYQSYLSFSGVGKVDSGNGWVDGVFSALAGYMNDAFYVGNSGYMKEMLLWPKRIHVRNDGREQWYDEKAEISENIIATISDGTGVTEGTFYIRRVIVERYSDITENIVISDDIAFYSDGAFFAPGLISMGISNYPPEFESINSAPLYGSYSVDVSGINGFLTVNYTVTKIATSVIFSWKFGTEVLFDELVSSVNDKTEYGQTRTIETRRAIIDVSKSSIIGQELTVSGWLSRNNSENRDILGAIHPVFGAVQESAQYRLQSNDINPIHKIREILTDDTAMNKPESSVNNENFIKAADRIWDEELGISWSITEKSCIDAINELCYHIEAGIRVNRQTGLYEMVLFRDDWFEEDEIHSIPENKIKKGSMQYEITNADEVINQVNVNFYDRKNIKNSSFSISESGLIQTLGRVNAETVDFPYFMSMRNAEIVANWKLKILSTGVLRGSFATGWREARKWNRYDLIRLPWSRRWAEPILVRIMNIKLGGPTSNEVSIEWVEVVPSTGMMNTTIVADEPVNTQPEVPKPCNAKVFELPYFEAVQALGEREVGIELADNPGVGYLCAIAEKPQNNSLNAALYADSGNGFERVATVNYCETAYLDQAIDRISSSFVVKNVGNIASVRVGSQIFINDEIMVYQSYDTETKVLTVKRGAFGIPQIHAANSILYFADDFIAVDQTLYVKSEIVDAKVLTTTPSGVLALSDAVNHEVEFNARAIRPYPPANVKINNSYWPETHVITNNIVLVWAHRNRAQQTGGEIIGWYDGDVTVESGVTYAYELISENVVLDYQSNIDVNTATILASVLKPNKPHTLKLWSVRDGFNSYQIFEHSFFVESASLILTASATKSNVFGNTVPTASVTVNVDESLGANVRFDGSSISGKAQPGAIITIEVNE